MEVKGLAVSVPAIKRNRGVAFQELQKREEPFSDKTRFFRECGV
jgi:hypothetical protein